MIFEIIPHAHSLSAVLIRPLHCVDAWDLYRMLDAAFPYNENTYEGDSWNFHICSAGGYENAIEFLN